MGKKYKCDFCDITIKDNLAMRKNHLNGLKHKISRNDYYEKFKDPQQILDDHQNKATCVRIKNNQECKFGSFCRHSHYTSGQLDELRRNIKEEHLQASLWFEYYKTVPPPNTLLNNHKSKRVDWKYPKEWLTRHDLPPSLQFRNLKLISNTNQKSKWGPPPDSKNSEAYNLNLSMK